MVSHIDYYLSIELFECAASPWDIPCRFECYDISSELVLIGSKLYSIPLWSTLSFKITLLIDIFVFVQNLPSLITKLNYFFNFSSFYM